MESDALTDRITLTPAPTSSNTASQSSLFSLPIGPLDFALRSFYFTAIILLAVIIIMAIKSCKKRKAKKNNTWMILKYSVRSVLSVSFY